MSPPPHAPAGAPGRVAEALRWIPRRLQGRPDREHEMSFNRLAFAALITGSLLASGRSASPSALMLMAAYIPLALGILVHIVVFPAVSNLRRFCALLLDTVFLSWQLHLGGELGAAFFPIYLWVAFGNGFRFGLNWLRMAMLMTFAGFATVVLTTPFWVAQGHLSVGLLASLLVLPTYAGTLIRRLSTARQQAEQANEAKTLFLASVSHELRTPLTAIIGMGGMLRVTKLDPSQKEMAETMQDAATSLLSLITSILDYAQIEAGRMTVETAPFDLPALLRETRGLVAAQARIKGLAVAIHIDARTPAWILSSRRDLSDILVNVAANAVKFTEHGAVVIAVDAEPATSAAARLTIRVIDSGIGISQEAQQKIFESFTQADPSIRNRYGGTGLGLSIARRRAELLGGSLEVRSLEGQGAEFTLEMAAEVPAERADPGGDPLCVILPGPSSPRRDRLSQLLTSAGHSTIGVQEATKRLTQAARSPSRADHSLVLMIIDDASPKDFLPTAEVSDLQALAPGLPCVIAPAEERAGFDHLAWPFSAVLLSGDTELDVRAAMAIVRAQARGGAAPSAADDVATPAQRRRVLIADDNLVNRRVLSKILETAGHSVTTVEDGEAALDALESQREHFDVVLMDMNMPVMDGLEATKLYRFMEVGTLHMPIVGLTADATPEAAQRCLDAGMDRCVTKPVRPEVLIKLVTELAAGPDRPGDPPGSPDVASDFAARRQAAGPVLDPDMLRMLEQLGGADFLSKLVEDFLTEAQETVALIIEAAGQADQPRFRSAVHALQSSAANIGAKSLAELCGGWQRFRGAEFAREAPLIPHVLKTEMARTRDALMGARESLAC